MKPSKQSVRIGAASLVVAASLLAVAGTASAASGPGPMSRRRAECVAEINRRVTALGQARARIDGSHKLTADQKAAIDSDLDAVVANLQTVNLPAVQSARTPATLAAACSAIFADNRVFAVVLPEIKYTSTIDAIGNYNDRVVADAAVAKAAGKDTTEVDAKTADASAKLSDAAAQLATVTPASFNADPSSAAPVWQAVQADLFTAFVDTVTAYDLLGHL
ncbi:MAG: hypothetical protein U0V73_09540 [Acidimicrobiia bacterium]